VPLCLMWTVWHERTSRIFEDVEHSTTKLGDLFFGCLFDWARVWGFTSEISVAAFVVSLNFSKSHTIALLQLFLLPSACFMHLEGVSVSF
jgi:hypothetical protein